MSTITTGSFFGRWCTVHKVTCVVMSVRDIFRFGEKRESPKKSYCGEKTPPHTMKNDPDVFIHSFHHHTFFPSVDFFSFFTHTHTWIFTLFSIPFRCYSFFRGSVCCIIGSIYIDVIYRQFTFPFAILTPAETILIQVE